MRNIKAVAGIITAVTLSTAVIGGGVAVAQPATTDADVASQTGASTVETVDAATISQVNSILAREGSQALPAETDKLGLSADNKLLAFDRAGQELAFVDSTPQYRGDIQLYEDSFLQNATQAVVGCVGGVVGYDAILEILEKRVGYLAFVKFLAGRVGWGLAVTCASGAVSSAMGW